MNQNRDWSPERYLKFGNERTQPSIDIVNRIKINYQPQTIIDMGCGPGNSSKVLTDRWPDAKLVGVDHSPTMIERAQKDYPQNEWIVADAATFLPKNKVDIVFSNATIQWIFDHANLLKMFCSLLSDRGVLAFQVPKFDEMPVRLAIEKVAQAERWKRKTGDCFKVFTFHDCSYYYDILSKDLASIDLWETNYFHVLESHRAIIEWVKGAGMRPYLDCLENDSERAEFEETVLKEVKQTYFLQENGKVLFPFKRLFVIGYKTV